MPIRDFLAPGAVVVGMATAAAVGQNQVQISKGAPRTDLPPVASSASAAPAAAVFPDAGGVSFSGPVGFGDVTRLPLNRTVDGKYVTDFLVTNPECSDQVVSFSVQLFDRNRERLEVQSDVKRVERNPNPDPAVKEDPTPNGPWSLKPGEADIFRLTIAGASESTSGRFGPVWSAFWSEPLNYGYWTGHLPSTGSLLLTRHSPRAEMRAENTVAQTGSNVAQTRTNAAKTANSAAKSRTNTAKTANNAAKARNITPKAGNSGVKTENDVAKTDHSVAGCVSGPQQTSRAARPLVLEPPLPSGLDTGVLLASLALAGLVTLICVILVVKSSTNLLDPLPAMPFDVKNSWAANFAVGGGLITGLMTTAILASDRYSSSSASYGVLAALFAALVPLGAALYGLTRPASGAGATKGDGYVATYLLTTLIVLWGAFGQLLLIGMFFRELDLAAVLSPVSAGLLIWATKIVMLSLAIYAVVGSIGTIAGAAPEPEVEVQPEPPQTGESKAAPPPPPPETNQRPALSTNYRPAAMI